MNILSTTQFIYAIGALLMVAAVAIGLWYGVNFLIKLRYVSGGRHPGTITLTEVFLFALAAGLLIYFPSTIVAVVTTVFGDAGSESSPLSWTTSTGGSGGSTEAQFAGMISAFFKLCGLFALISAAKSLPKLNKESGMQGSITLGMIAVKAVAGAALLRPVSTAENLGTIFKPILSFATWLSSNGA